MSTLKFLVIGDVGVGKTQLVNSFCNFRGSNPKYSTSGYVPEITTEWETGNGTKVTIRFWDTNGRETFGSFTPLVYQGYHCLIVLYDRTNEDTLTKIPEFFGGILMSSDASLKVLLGNKAELSDSSLRDKVDIVARNYDFDMIEDVPVDKNELRNVFASIVQMLMSKVSSFEMCSSANSSLKCTTDGILELAAKCASTLTENNLDRVITPLKTLLVPLLEGTGNTNLRFIAEIIEEYPSIANGNREGRLLWLYRLISALFQLRQQPVITLSPDATAE